MKQTERNVLAMVFLFSTILAAALVPHANAEEAMQPRISASLEDNGVRVVFSDVSLYFNASNGGEITQYYDLSVDPTCSRNLINLGWGPWYNLLPLFSCLFYRPHIYPELLLSTGGDSSATVTLISNTTESIVLQTSSRIMSLSGLIAKDAYGSDIRVTTTWIIHYDGVVSAERTFSLPSFAPVPAGWRWYPFYLTRTAGFAPSGTFCVFNTTHVDTVIMNETAYRNFFEYYPVMPKDTSGIFGVAAPFENLAIGGDGTHNILVAYWYDELIGVDEWRSDNYHSNTRDILETGPMHEFSETKNFTTHAYHALVHFTHQDVNEARLTEFARYLADNPTIGRLMECSLSSNKEVYHPGDHIEFYLSGTTYHNLTGVTAKLTARNSAYRVIYQQDYGPGDLRAGQVFNITLYEGTVQPLPSSYTISFEIFSQAGIPIAFSSATLIVES